jgi:hypothetical protein
LKGRIVLYGKKPLQIHTILPQLEGFLLLFLIVANINDGEILNIFVLLRSLKAKCLPYELSPNKPNKNSTLCKKQAMQ